MNKRSGKSRSVHKNALVMNIQELHIKMATFTYLFVAFIVFMNFSITLGDVPDCPLGYYGQECQNICGPCIGGPVFCDPSDGHCVNGCDWGYIGATCAEICEAGTWGYDCRESCAETCKESGCNPHDGACSAAGCVPGYTGQNCDEECPRNKYGPECKLTCTCPLPCGCDHVTGTCYTSCEEEAKWKRDAANDHDHEEEDKDKQTVTHHGKSTQMMCSEMKDKFHALSDKLKEKVGVPYWPLWTISGITFGITMIVYLIERVRDRGGQRYMENWEMENLDPMFIQEFESKFDPPTDDKKFQEEGSDIDIPAKKKSTRGTIGR